MSKPKKPNTTLTERVKISNGFTLDLLADTGTFTKRILRKFPYETEDYEQYPAPKTDSDNYLVSFGPSDLLSLDGSPPVLKKPVSEPIRKMVQNLNPTTEAMLVFQTQGF